MRCPMCGKQNPAEAEKCQFCGARLRPVNSPSPAVPPSASTPKEPSAAPPPAPRKEGQDDMDWLRSLSSPDSQAPGGPEPSGELGPEQQEGEDPPTWLDRIRTRSKQEPEAISPIGRNPLETPPPEVGASPAEAGAASPDASGAPQKAEDWLQNLRPSGEPPESTPSGGDFSLRPASRKTRIG